MKRLKGSSFLKHCKFWISQWWIQGRPWCPAPWKPMLSHMFLPESACIRGWCPLMGNPGSAAVKRAYYSLNPYPVLLWLDFYQNAALCLTARTTLISPMLSIFYCFQCRCGDGPWVLKVSAVTIDHSTIYLKPFNLSVPLSYPQTNSNCWPFQCPSLTHRPIAIVGLSVPLAYPQTNRNCWPCYVKPRTVADPGFPIGGTDLRHVCFTAKAHAKTKELDPVGGSANVESSSMYSSVQVNLDALYGR